VVADDYADPEFGSGAVKITPAHDANDFDVSQRTGLPAMDVMTPEASMSDAVPEPFRGLDRYDARRAVVAAFEELGLLEKVEDHTLSVPHCYRCDTVVEPRLSDQWWVRMKPLADPALQAWRDGTRALHAGAVRAHVRVLAGEHPRLVHQPPALVGAPHPRVVLRLRRDDGGARGPHLVPALR
jgi:valyl-tRNA synthetase